MPELPEVEITRRHLETALLGRTVVNVEVGHQRTARYNASVDELVTRLTGRRVISVGRHGKFLVARLDDGHTMVAHLGMSGRFSITDEETERPPHTHMVALLDNGTEIRFVDPRTFGFVAVFDEDELAASGLARLGSDALLSPPSVGELAGRLSGRTAPIKALLLDQRPIAGLGNIYADEVLHAAGIHPLTPGGQIDDQGLSGLLAATELVLAGALENGGTTLGDLAYLLPDGAAGENLDRLAVYGRAGEPCLRCSTPISRIVIRARSTYFCPSCQTR